MNFLYNFLASVFISLAIQSGIQYSSIEKAFNSNNSTEIVSFGKDKVLLNVLGKEGAYSRSQAGLILKDFFTKKPSGTFKFILKGKESSEGTFAIGNYDCKGEVFRVTMQFKKESSEYKMESLTIER
jgi:hypothetical protein